MAAIVTDEDFRMAASQWLSTQTLQGAGFVDAGERKIYDERPGGTVEITPALSVLEAALDAAIAAAALEEEREAARVKLVELKMYLSNKLESATPDLLVICNTIKAGINGNTFLNTMFLNAARLKNSVYGWGVADPATLLSPPATGSGNAAVTARQRYLEIALAVIAVRT